MKAVGIKKPGSKKILIEGGMLMESITIPAWPCRVSLRLVFDKTEGG